MTYLVGLWFVITFDCVKCRAPIDQPFSQESSASLNLIGDRAAHQVYDHSLMVKHATQADKWCPEWVSPWPQSQWTDTPVAPVLTIWLSSHPTAADYCAAGGWQLYSPPLFVLTLSILSDNTVLSVFNVNAINHIWHAHIRTAARGRQRISDSGQWCYSGRVPALDCCWHDWLSKA